MLARQNLDTECEGAHGAHAKCRAFTAQLLIRYTDGSSQLVRTVAAAGDDGDSDALWTATTAANPIVYTHLYHGEIFDARLLPSDSTTVPTGAVDGAASGWTPASRFEGADRIGKLSLHSFPPIGVAARVAPRSITRLPAVGKTTTQLAN